MADAGRQEIKRLLDAPSTSLASGAQTMVGGLTQKSSDQEFRVRSAGYQGLDDIRAYYTRLRRKVAKVETSSPRKADVMTALRAYSAGLADFEAALRDTSDEQVALLKRATARSKAAASDLAKARGRL